MQAMILAAGSGVRMGELTKNTPKPLLKINNKTLIELNIEKLYNANIFDIVVNTHYFGGKIINHLKKYNIKFSQEQQKLESGGGIINALNLLNNEFIIINADIVHNYDLSKLCLPKNSLAHLILVDNPKHNINGDFRFKDKKLTFSGIGIYNKKLFKNYQNGYLKLSSILYENLINISFEYFDGLWLDIGTPKRLKEANQAY